MKLNQFLIESALVEVRTFVGAALYENINDYLSLTLAKLKNKSPEENFKKGDANSIDLAHLAIILVGLKIIANPDHRAAITKRDVGVNPNDAKELFDLLSNVDKLGKDPDDVTKVFLALVKLAPTTLKKQRQELEVFKTGDDAERKHAAQQLEQMLHKVNQIFGKVRTAASGAAKAVQIPSLGEL